MNDIRTTNPASVVKEMRTIAIVAYEGVQLLDIAGPAAVFAEATAVNGRPLYQVQVVSAAGGPVSTSAGVTIKTSCLAHRQVPLAMVVVAGADRPALDMASRDERLRYEIVSLAGTVERLASVCTGAFMLAAWGLLDGRRAATHWAGASAFTRLFPAVALDRNALFVRDGKIWTSAGVSTGIDMALAMVEADHGSALATAVARRLVLPSRRPGHQSQFSALLDAQAGPYATLTEWVADNLAADLSLEALADRAGQAPRTFHRRFSKALGMTPAAFVERLRVDRARLLLETGLSQDQIARQLGFGGQDQFARAFRRVFALAPTIYRALHVRSDSDHAI